MKRMRTRAETVSAGPADLMVSHLFHLEGIDSVIMENRCLVVQAGAGTRLLREGMRHEGIHLAFGGGRHRVDMSVFGPTYSFGWLGILAMPPTSCRPHAAAHSRKGTQPCSIVNDPHAASRAGNYTGLPMD